MNFLTRNPKDLLSGLLFLAAGLFFFVYSHEYQLGTARRMGPGYFPYFLSIGLMIIGGLVLARGLLREGGELGRFAWKELTVIIVGILLFAFLVRPAGMVPAVMLYVVCAAFAYPPVRPIPVAITAVLLSAFCWLVFVRGLGLPFPAFGTWFGG